MHATNNKHLSNYNPRFIQPNNHTQGSMAFRLHAWLYDSCMGYIVKSWALKIVGTTGRQLATCCGWQRWQRYGWLAVGEPSGHLKKILVPENCKSCTILLKTIVFYSNLVIFVQLLQLFWVVKSWKSCTFLLKSFVFIAI